MSEQTQTQMGNDLPSNENQDRPVYVASKNFKHSSHMLYPNEPPTDRQLKYIIKLKKEFGLSRAVKIPRNRKHASLIIEAILRGDF